MHFSIMVRYVLPTSKLFEGPSRETAPRRPEVTRGTPPRRRRVVAAAATLAPVPSGSGLKPVAKGRGSLLSVDQVIIESF
jgi:hypothetical protein